MRIFATNMFSDLKRILEFCHISGGNASTVCDFSEGADVQTETAEPFF